MKADSPLGEVDFSTNTNFVMTPARAIIIIIIRREISFTDQYEINGHTCVITDLYCSYRGYTFSVAEVSTPTSFLSPRKFWFVTLISREISRYDRVAYLFYISRISDVTFSVAL